MNAITRKRSTERTQYLHDIMSTALEGGVNYWSTARDIERTGTPEQRRDSAFRWDYVAYTLTESPASDGCSHDDHQDAPRCRGHRVDIEVVASGLSRMRKAGDMRSHMREADDENDAGEIDAGDADQIVQWGIFGKGIYG